MSSTVGWYQRKKKTKHLELGGQNTKRATSQDGKLEIVFEGWLVKKPSFLEELAHRNIDTKNESDAELALAVYTTLGDGGLDMLEGEFALAIWDSSKYQLVLANDSFGSKPIYYRETEDGQLLFGLHIGPIIEKSGEKAQPNQKIIFQYLQYGTTDEASETFFEGIYRLLPGQMLIVDESEVRTREYSSLQTDLSLVADEGHEVVPVQGLVELLQKSVQNQFNSSARNSSGVAVDLSGGFVSSAIATSVLEDTEQAKAFVANLSGVEKSRQSPIDKSLEAASDQLAIQEVNIDASQFLEDLVDFVKIQEEPVSNANPYIQYAIMRQVSVDKRVSLLLSGLGADEVFMRAKPVISSKLTIESLLNDEFVKQCSVEVSEKQFSNSKQQLLDIIFSSRLPALLRYQHKNALHFGVDNRTPLVNRELVSHIFHLPNDTLATNRRRGSILYDQMRQLLSSGPIGSSGGASLVAPQEAWFLRIKNSIYEILSSPEFLSRGYFDGSKIKIAFEDFIRRPHKYDTAIFWRILNVELWLREFIDPPKKQTKKLPIKDDYSPNEGKSLLLTSAYDNQQYHRYPIRTDLVDETTDIVKFIVGYIESFMEKLPKKYSIQDNAWYIFVSEKIVAISQGRSYFIWDIKARPSARLLSKFVRKTPIGIGLGDPVTMELAMREAGSLRIIASAVIGALGKLVGKRGLFYILAGSNVRAIDGPTEYSVYPSNVSAKLPPKDPDVVARQISQAIGQSQKITKAHKDLFQGTVIIDANDIGRNILGKDVAVDNEFLEALFADNPLGQAKQQTPLAVVVERHK